MTIELVKEKMRTHCGTGSQFMHLTLMNEHSQVVADMSDDSLVKKYEISEEDYLKRENNFRAWKEDKLKADPTWSLSKQIKRQQDERMKKLDPNFVPAPEKEKVSDDEHMAELAAAIKVDDLCEVNPGGKRASVKFVGKIPAIAPGYWVGVQYDEPVGKNDGAVKGKRFFECPPNFGGFLRPDKVTVGDYPELDIFDEDEDLND